MKLKETIRPIHPVNSKPTCVKLGCALLATHIHEVEWRVSGKTGTSHFPVCGKHRLREVAA